ncbi:MAG TPA: hypothetical protein VH599_13435 [Ktedonobacterales bacterium]
MKQVHVLLVAAIGGIIGAIIADLITVLWKPDLGATRCHISAG